VPTAHRKPRGVHPYTDGRGRSCYRIEYVGTDGARHFKRLGRVTLREAVQERENLNVAIRRREIVVAGDGPTFAQVREEYEAARRVRRRTADQYDAHLRRYCQGFDYRRVSDIGRADIVVWLGHLRSARTGGAMSEASKTQALAALSAVLGYAAEVGYIARNPCRDLSRNQRPRQGESRRRFLTRDEEARLLAYCGSRPWLRPIIVVALNQALRLGEVAGLQWADVDFAGNTLRVHRQLSREGTLAPTKGAGRDRRDRRDVHPVRLMAASREALIELADSCDGFVFRDRRGQPRLPRNIARAFRNVVTEAGLRETEDGKVTFHSLRHTGISRLANAADVALVYVRDFAGHTSLATTETYVHRIESDAATAAAERAMAGTFLARGTGIGED